VTARRLVLFALAATLAPGCGGSDCSTRTSTHEEWVQNVSPVCPANQAGDCDWSFCSQNCPDLKGTDNARFELASCRMQSTTLSCRFNLSTEWCE